MAAAAELPHRTEIVVELPPSTDELAGTLQSELSRYLQEMLQDLRIPVGASVAIQTNDEKRWPRVFPYRMRIDGQPCRVPLQYFSGKDEQASPSPSDVARALYVNRELLLSTILCEKIRETWSHESPQAYFTEFSAPDFHDVLALLVRRGCHIDRAKTWSEGRTIAREDRNVERCFEGIIADPGATAIRILWSRSQYEKLSGSGLPGQPPIDGPSLQELLNRWDDDVFAQLGLIMPAITLAEDANLEEPEFRIQINDLRLPRKTGTSRTAGFVVQSLTTEVQKHAGHFLNTAVVQCSLDLLRESVPALVDAVLKRFDILMLTRIMRELLEDEISIRDARRILEGLLAIEGMMELGPGDVRNTAVFDLAFYTQEARESLRRYISQKHSGKDNCLYALIMDPQIENRIALSAREPLSETQHLRLLEAILRGVAAAGEMENEIVLLTKPEARRTLRNLVAKEFPTLPVVSYGDLSPDTNIKPAGQITWDSGEK